MIKVSFIVPVYKVEKYLTQCVESIIRQSYKAIEVVLVDDGSPDGCPELCERLALKDNRIRVFHKPNGGLSDARNTGLKLATGDYIVFVDGDDFWLSETSLISLIEIATKYPSLDFVGFNCCYYYTYSGKLIPWVSYHQALSNPTNKNVALTTLVKSGTIPMSACLKLLKRSFLLDNKLFFQKGQIAEDIPWFINLLNATNQCIFANDYVYAYRQNVSGSITNSAGQRSFDSLFDIFKSELLKIEDRSFDEEATIALKSFLAYEYCILLTYLNSFPREVRKSIRQQLYAYRTILCFTVNPKVRKASLVYKLFGIRILEFVLTFYQCLNLRKK